MATRRFLRHIMLALCAAAFLAACADDVNVKTRGSSDTREKVGVKLGLPF